MLTALGDLADRGALEALGNRLDPNVELDVDVRDEVWNVITKLLAKADLPTLNEWERKTAVVDLPQRHEQVLGMLASKLADVQPKSIRLIEVRKNRGDLFEASKRWDAASVQYRLAYDQTKITSAPNISNIRDGLALKLLNALLNQGVFDQAVEHLSTIAAARSTLEEEALKRTLDYLQSRLDPPVAFKSINAALELISALEKAQLPGLTRPPLSKKIDQLKAEALNLRQNLGTTP